MRFLAGSGFIEYGNTDLLTNGIIRGGHCYFAHYSGLFASVLTVISVLALYKKVFPGASVLKAFKNASSFSASALKCIFSVYRSLRYFLK